MPRIIAEVKQVMASFRCYDNSDVIATLIMTNFHLNTTVVAIFPNACLWRHSLYSNLVLTLKTNCVKPSSYICQYGQCCCNTALLSFRLFRKNLGNLRDIFGQMVYRPPPNPAWEKNFPYAYDCACSWRDYPQSCWPLAGVIEVMPGSNGFVQRVKVKTKTTVLERPVAKCMLLEATEENEH